MALRRAVVRAVSSRRREGGNSREQRRTVLTKADLPTAVVNTQYAVRGTLVLRALALEKKLQEDAAFRAASGIERITYCNIGNPQELGQLPITFFRQVLSLLENPELLSRAAQLGIPADAVERAHYLLQRIPGGTGAYSNSAGLDVVREEVANFICRRDGRAGDASYTSPANIFLSDGASPSVQRCLQLLIRPNSGDAIMIPIPQYPLYSASITLLGGAQAEYYLDEQRGWGLTPSELERSFTAARAAGKNPRAVVIINPGNPTGQCLSKEDMKGIIQFAHSNNLVLMADEVYQENVYIKHRRPFVSFKSVKHEMGAKYANLELMSFHSVSKGFVGECGKRGGYVEFDGLSEEFKEQYYKLASINLCPNVLGQLLLSLMVRPPVAGEASYELYAKQRDDIYNSLLRRAQLVTSTLNTLKGVSCNEAEGAMYAFPQVTLPEKAIATAKARNIAPDLLYCLELLESTGICVVPGSGFGQKDGTYHFRTTFLPQEAHLKSVLRKFEAFHTEFLKRYS